MATLQERVAERYPDLIPLLRVPEIGKLLTQAVSETKPMSPGVFMSKLRTTRWFRSQSETARRWWVTAAMDPGEALKQRRTMNEEIGNLAAQMGVKLTSGDLYWLRENALKQGMAPDSTWVRLQIGKMLGKGGRAADAGAYRTTVEQLRTISKGGYFWNIPNHVAQKWGTWIITGQKTMEDFQAVVQQEAMQRYPHMKEQLASGMSVNDVVRPFAEVYANEYDTTAEEIMATMRTHAGSPTRQLLGIRDPKTGNTRMPTELEALRLARKDPKWWTTTSGRQNDARLSTFLLQQLGRRA
jgi:hypothetical protein